MFVAYSVGPCSRQAKWIDLAYFFLAVSSRSFSVFRCTNWLEQANVPFSGTDFLRHSSGKRCESRLEKCKEIPLLLSQVRAPLRQLQTSQVPPADCCGTLLASEFCQPATAPAYGPLPCALPGAMACPYVFTKSWPIPSFTSDSGPAAKFES